MNFRESNLIRNRFRLILAIVFMTMIAFAGCSKNDYGTNSTPGGGSSGGTGYGNTGGSGNTGGGNTGGGNTGGSTKGAYKVSMQNMSFSPSAITVTAGSMVTWTNNDSYAHTVTSGTPNHPDGKFDSGAISSGGTYSYTFSAKGTYNYYCRYHSSMMSGTVTVQ